jgi:hypothetical protein
MLRKALSNGVMFPSSTEGSDALDAGQETPPAAERLPA